MAALLSLGCTVLLNAHRLQHIRRFDRVCVLHGGRVAEYDTPHTLLAEPNGHLSAMWRASHAPRHSTVG